MISKLDSLQNTYYSLEDSEFLDTVIADIKSFTGRHWNNSKAVLVFPPFNNFRRFLVHSVVKDVFSDEDLGTFSIGQELSRRIVVCNKLLLNDKVNVEDGDNSTLPLSKKMKEEKSKPAVINKDITRTRTPTVNIYRPPAARFAESRSITTVTEEVKVKDVRRSRVRRPDQQVYVPRPKRASYSAINSAAVPDSSSNKESLRRIVNDPVVQYVENQKSSSKLNSHRNSVQEDISFSEDSSSLSSCETLSGNAVTNLRVNATQQTALPNSDDDITQVSSKHLKSCCTLNNSSSSSRCNDDSETTVIDLEEYEVTVKEKNKSQEYRNDKSSECGYLNNSCNSSSSSNSSSNVTRDEQNHNFDDSADDIRVIATVRSESDHNKVQEDEECELLRKERVEIIDVENETTLIIDSDETVKGDVEKETINNSQSISTNCLSSGEVEIDCEVLYSGDTSLDSSSHSVEIIETSGEKQKNGDGNDVLEKSSHEDRNLKNRRILHSFPPVSDVLIITDPVKDETVVENEVVVSDKKSVDSVDSETKVNKSGDNKVNSYDKVKNKKVSKSAEVTAAVTTVSINRDECDWESMFTDDGECLVPGLIEELTRNVGRVKVATAESDYRSYQTSDERSTDGECIIEIYDFPAEFKTHDLLTVFAAYRNRSFHIKWVDDTHALGIFSSPLVADEVLASDLPFVKTRPLRLAIAESKIKARNLILPPMERPKTCTAMARRLVTGALGLRLPSASKEREAEKKVLREAREKRRLEAKQREAIWEGLS